MTPRSEMHSASYVFGSEGIMNQTGGWNTGLAFLFGLLSVQWTVCCFYPFVGSTFTDVDFFLDDSEFLWRGVVIHQMLSDTKGL